MEEKCALTEFKLENGSTILVETIVHNKNRKTELLSTREDVVKVATKTFNETIGSIQGVAETAINNIKEIAHPPKEITLELGIKLSGEAGAIIAKASTEGNIKVVLKWLSS